VGTHLGHTQARRRVLELVHHSSGRLPIEELHARLYSHRHAADRAVSALAEQGHLVVHEFVATDRLGRPRVATTLAPATVPGPANGRAALPRFSGAALRGARLRARVTIAALAKELSVGESAVRWWERATVVPPARGREILHALARLQARSDPRRPVSGCTARRLRAARAATGWSQARLAAALGVSQSTVANWEAGRGLTLENARRTYRLLRETKPSPRLEPHQLQELRALRGWSQAELAQRVGVSVATIKRWEAGRTDVPGHRSQLLTRLMGT
jgi:transcriptional regulator with XRE-family HTH domain